MADLRRKAGDTSKKARVSSGVKAEGNSQGKIWDVDSADEENM